jgi:flagellar protein FlaJ
MEKVEIIILMVSAILFMLLLALNFLFLNNTIILALSVLFLLFPYLLYKSTIASREKKLDKLFTNFLLDLGSVMETRISLMQAMPSVCERDYGILTKYIKKLNAEISWGVPFLDAFIKIGRETKSKLINKSISVIISAFVSGGDLKRIFYAIGHHTNELMKIKETIKSRTRVITLTCYLIFFCLLFTLLMIRKTFIPMFVEQGAMNVEEMSNIIFHMLIVQAIFAGLVAGQMGENSIFMGVKHSLILTLITVIVYGLFV